MKKNSFLDVRKVWIIILSLIIVVCAFALWRTEVAERNAIAHVNAEKELEAKRRREGWVEYEDNWYKPNDNLETYLIIGVDSTDPLKDYGDYGNYIQSDFLMVAILNSEDKTTTLYQINRDTMADIPVLGVTGQYAGTIFGQLALAHTYGNGLQPSCENTVTAVQNFLGGVEIDHYVSINMGAIPYINDMIGGVEVYVEDDFSEIDSSLVKDSKVLLKGQQALNFLRIRKGLEDSTNITRMNRHKKYLEGLYAKTDELANFNITPQQAEYLDKYILSDCSLANLNTLAKNFLDYTFKDYLLVPGEAKNGTEFVEFYADEELLREQVINLFYVKQ